MVTTNTSASQEASSSMSERAERLIPLLRARAPEIDRLGKLPPDVVKAVDETGAYRMCVPAEYGGHPVSAQERVRTLINLGRGNLSVAWSVQNAQPPVEMAPYFSAEMARELYETDHVGPLAGASIFNLSHAIGVGEQVPGGLMVYGSWSFVSNCRMAAWVGGGVTWTDDTGQERRSLVLMPRSQVHIADDWHVSAMKGTASNSVYIEEHEKVFVPEHRMLDVSPKLGATFKLIWLDTAAQIIGAASGAFDVFMEKAGKRAPFGMPYASMTAMPVVQALVARASARINIHKVALLNNARLYDEERERIDDAEWSRIAFESQWTAHQMREVAEELRDVMGSSTALETDLLGGFARDATCMTLHGTMRRGWTEEVRGRVLFGITEPRPNIQTKPGTTVPVKHKELIE